MRVKCSLPKKQLIKLKITIKKAELLDRIGTVESLISQKEEEKRIAHEAETKANSKIELSMLQTMENQKFIGIVRIECFKTIKSKCCRDDRGRCKLLQEKL